MQLPTSYRKKLFYIALFVLVSMSLNFSLEKSLTVTGKVTTESTFERTENKRIKSKKSKAKSKSKQGPIYNAQTAIQLVKDIGTKVLPQDEKTSQVFGECMKFIVDQPDTYTNQLNNFWAKMSSIASKASQWDNNNFNEIINALGSKNVLYNDQSNSCGSLQVQGHVDASKIDGILSQGTYFGGFNNNSNAPKRKFIEGMVSHHRDIIDSNTFEVINQVSRGDGTDQNTNPSGKQPSAPAPKMAQAPSGTTPAPSGTTPAPSGTTPAPSGTTPAPSGASPTPSGTTPAPSGTTPAPSGASPTPSGTTPAPSGASPTPSGTTPAPSTTTPQNTSGAAPSTIVAPSSALPSGQPAPNSSSSTPAKPSSVTPSSVAPSTQSPLSRKRLLKL